MAPAHLPNGRHSSDDDGIDDRPEQARSLEMMTKWAKENDLYDSMDRVLKSERMERERAHSRGDSVTSTVSMTSADSLVLWTEQKKITVQAAKERQRLRREQSAKRMSMLAVEMGHANDGFTHLPDMPDPAGKIGSLYDFYTPHTPDLKMLWSSAGDGGLEFDHTVVQQIMHQACSLHLPGQPYDASKVPGICASIAQYGITALQNLRLPYRFVVHAVIVSAKMEGLHVRTGCLWSPSGDGTMTMDIQTDTMRCIVSVHNFSF